MQESISKGSIIVLQNEDRQESFHIDDVVGYGANCIAYDVHREDRNGHRYFYRMKECFPYNAGASRLGVSIDWPDENKKDEVFAEFKEAHYKLLELQSDPAFGNQTAHVIDLYEGNNTLYSLMGVDFGETFDRINLRSLEDLLLVIYDLAKVVSAYHDRGLLHLDLKPQNFLISIKPVRSICLFDVDTVTDMDDLRERGIYALSYSEGWCAPEQRQCAIGKITPATDVYAIGAILFQKIFGRLPNSQDTYKFARWEFDTELFENINPAIKRILTDIFHHTISASPARRYADAGILSEKLKDAVSVSRQKIFLRSECPISIVDFVGRGKELKEIHHALLADNKVVIHGFGGIGKSSLALEYAAQHGKDYDVVVFLRYQGSIRDALLSVDIVNYEEDGEQRRLKELKRLLTSNTLLIIDNFDAAIGDDPDFEDLLKLKSKIIITSRTDFSSVYQGSLVQIECGEFSYPELREIFFGNCGAEISENELPILEAVFRKTAYHTFATVLAAKQMHASGLSLTELNDELGKGLRNLENREKVKTLKDGRVVKSHIPDMIRALFDIAHLDEISRQVLRDLYLLGRLTVKKYREIAGAKTETIDALNNLVEWGYVERRTVEGKIYFELHPLIQSLVSEELDPCLEKCENIAKYVMMQTWKYGNGEEYDCVEDPLTEAEREATTEFLCRLFDRLPFTEETVTELLDWLYSFMGMEYVAFPHRFDSDFRKLYDKMEMYERSGNVSGELKVDLLTCITSAWLMEYGVMYTVPPCEGKQYFSLREEKTDAYLEKLITTFSEKNNDEIQSYKRFCTLAQQIANRECDPFEFMLMWRKEKTDMAVEFYKTLMVLFPERKEDYELIAEFIMEQKDYREPEKKEEPAEEELLEQKYWKTFNESEDKAAIAKQILEDSDYELGAKANLIFDLFDSFFWGLNMRGSRGLQKDEDKTEELTSYRKAAEVVAEICRQRDFVPEADSDEQEALISLEIYRYICQALTAPLDEAVDAMSKVLFGYSGPYYFVGDMGLWWQKDNIITVPLSTSARTLVNTCIAMKRRLSTVLDILVEEIEEALEKPETSATEKYLWYEEFARLASFAKKEHAVGSEEYVRFEKLGIVYRSKAKELYRNYDIEVEKADRGPAFNT